ADDALIDVRDLARELGLDTCRRALVEFIEGQNGVSAAAAAEGYADAFVYDALATPDTNGDEIQEDDGEGTELELDLDGSRGGHADFVEPYYDLSSAEETPAEEPAAPPTFADAPAERADFSEFSALSDTPPEPAAESKPEREAEPFTASRDAFQSDGYQDSATQDTSARLESVSGEPEAGADADAAEGEHDTDHEDAGSVEEPVEDAKSSRRRKRARSVRSRKDKLQSAARPQKLAPPPRPPAPVPPPAIHAAPTPPPPAPVATAKPANSGWLVEPSKAASFDPPVPVAPVQPPPPPPQPIALAPPAPVTPTVVTPVPPPIAMPAPLPRPVAPVIAAPPPIPLQKPAPAVPLAPPVPSAVKLKTEPPAGYAPPRRPRAEPVEDIYSPRAADPVDSGSGGFPWKMASGGLVLLVAALVAGRAYMTSGSDEEPSPRSPAVATAPVAPTGPAVLPKTGRIQIDTEPAGARVLLDGKHVGDSPVTIEAAAGRHTLTLATSTGSVRRNVRVEAGKTVALNVPIFSGWVEVASPIILEVSEDGKLLGTTEQNRLLLRPGRHVLTFTNRDLDYSTVQTVDIEPGEAKTLALDPKGTVNLNATPWAEVWIDGKKVGDTPLANLEIPLGTREIVFKNNGYVEQRVTRTVRANAPLAISVEMVKP
ncbi:MAG TPA: PEGA domain-containing protein, partial [Vicinamibacterales bacterium]|nr:PEGA domain-containing protein [Vicinamibacterales bacterium]